MQISEDVIYLLGLHNSSHHTQHHKEAKLNLIIYHYQVRIRTVWMCVGESLVMSLFTFLLISIRVNSKMASPYAQIKFKS